MGFAIRAEMDSAVKETISEIKDCEGRPLVYRDGSESDKEQVCNTLHVMTKTPQAFTLVVQRKRIDDDDNSQLDIFSSTVMMKQWHGGATFIVQLRPTWMSCQTLP